MKIIYARSHAIGGALIRLAQWGGRWSHCGILTPYGTVINARAFHGVVEESIRDFCARYTETDVVEVQAPNDEAGLEYARKAIGCGYDYKAIGNFILGCIGQSKTRFHCVELVESCLLAAGLRRFRVPPSKLTPHQSWMVA